MDNLINNSKKGINSKEQTQQKDFNPKIEVYFNLLNDSQIQLTFRDNGIGIRKENKNKIFEYGFTTTEGSGLGLTHIKELVEKIGGNIILNDNYNQGAEFLITFNKK